MREAAQEPGAQRPIQQAWPASPLSWGQGFQGRWARGLGACWPPPELGPAHRERFKQASSRCPLATTRWTWRRSGASCTWPSWSGRSSSAASLRGGRVGRREGGWGPARKPPEGESLPGGGNPHPWAGKPTLGPAQLRATARQGGPEQEGAVCSLRREAWWAVATHEGGPCLLSTADWSVFSAL